MSLTALPVADAGATRICHEDLAPVVNRFRVRQDASGCVMDPSPEAVQELKSVLQIACEVLERLDLTTQREALELDVRDWLTAGIGTAPRFDRSRDALVPPPDGGTVFFIAPFLTTNGPQPVGRRLDFFLAVREEPKELDALAVAFPHPKNACQSVRLISGSDGILKGNCIVFLRTCSRPHLSTARATRSSSSISSTGSTKRILAVRSPISSVRSRKATRRSAWRRPSVTAPAVFGAISTTTFTTRVRDHSTRTLP